MQDDYRKCKQYRVSYAEDRTQAFKNSLIGLPGIESAAHAETIPGRIWGQSPIGVASGPSDLSVPMSRMYAGFGYLETLGIKIIRGRTLNESFGTDSVAVVLSESAVAALQLDDPLGQEISHRDNGLTYTIAGVIEDINIESLHSAREPVVIFGPDPEYSNRPRQLFVVRLKAGMTDQGVAASSLTRAPVYCR